MTIVVIDGQGGGIGGRLIEQLRPYLPDAEIIAVGTNGMATAAMLRAGANIGATGENAAVYNCRDADIIAGPIGIMQANAMSGELTPAIARAVGESPARRVLIPVSRSRTYLAGLAEKPASRYLEDAVGLIVSLAKEE